MNKRFKPSKDTIIAVLSVLTIASVSIVALQENAMNKKDMEFSKLEKTYKTYKVDTDKELKLRDEVLEKYRNHLDKNDALIKEKDDKIKSLQSQLDKKESLTNRSISRGGARQVGTPIELTLTFYGDGAEENGGYAGINAYGDKLTAGTVASNVYPKGTQFRLSNGQVLTVQDRGGSNFNSYNRLDVFVPRLKGESDAQYEKRIASYGVKKVKAYKF